MTEPILSCFEKYNYKSGDKFVCRVSHVYDLSKFWIVTKPQELDRFQKLLCREYYKSRDVFKVAKEDIVHGMYCVVLCDGTFFRAKIVGWAQSAKNNLKANESEVQTFFLDYGMTGVTACENIYKLEAAFAKPPSFAVRASLACICPLDAHTWSISVVNRFNEIHNWVELDAVVVNSDPERLLVEIYCRRREPQEKPFYEILFSEKLAQPFVRRSETVEVNEVLASSWGGTRNLKYPYLFPTHEMLEEGKIPCQLEVFDSIFPKMSLMSLCMYCRRSVSF